MLDDDQLNELFTDVEDKLNETGAWVDVIAEAGGEIAFVQLDVEFAGDEGWIFVGRVVTEAKVDVDENLRKKIFDDLEIIADKLQPRFEEIGLDPQMMLDYKVEVIADSEQ